MSYDRQDPRVRIVGLKTSDDSGLAACALPAPGLAWRLAAERDGVRQIAYEVQRCAVGDFVAPLSSGRQDRGLPAASWLGPALRSREVAWVRVRIWTDQGLTAWSAGLRIEGSLFELSDWIARPISPVSNVGRTMAGPVPLVRREFMVAPGLVQARLYVSALGVQETWLNGQPVAPDLLEPGWTDYRHRIAFSSYDVTALLGEGANAISAAIGDGWWRGNLTWMERRAVYGETTAFLAQLELTYADGRRETVATDEAWRGGTGALRSADIYDGCTIDQRSEQPGWRETGFAETGWEPVEVQPLPVRLEQRAMPPVRVVETIAPALGRRGDVVTVDAGQNLTGFLQLTVTAAGEGMVTVRHAEVLKPDGGLFTEALRAARATDVYHLAPGTSVLEPSFTYHGFRYAEIELSPGVRLDHVEVMVAASALTPVGTFRCSDARLNRLQDNIIWSQRGNFISIPTDCPQRDERLGWTGDIQVFAPTAAANFDSRAFLASWLVDLASEQRADGNVPSTVPNVIQGHEYEYGGIGWSDAATLVPWALYEAYGDREVLARQFPSMRAWVDYGLSRIGAEGVWSGDFHLGDWLDPGAPPDKPEEATTDRDFIATAYLAHSLDVVARSAALLGQDDLANGYRQRGAAVAAAAWLKWADAAAQTQTGCAMAIEFGIAPPAEQKALGRKLAELVERNAGRIATGFLGTPLVLPALTRTGHVGAAYALLFNEQAPGWLYQVINGATTMWERWDAIKPGGELHLGEMAAEDAASMTSFNHYAYGSVGQWLYRSLAGIAPSSPGYETIVFAPQPGGGLTWAEASIDTPYGLAAIRWERRGADLLVSIDVPPGAKGSFLAPPGWEAAGDELLAGKHRFTLRSK